MIPKPPAPAGGLTLRIVSALVMAPLALAAAWFGAPYLTVLVLLGGIGMGWEWARLSGAATPSVLVLVMATPALAAIAIAFGAVAAALAIAVLGALAVAGAAAAVETSSPLWTAIGTLWLSLPCVAMLFVAAARDGRLSILWLLVVVWASDSGAYAFGRLIGGKRLVPHLSPNKTWAGAVGGLFCAALVGGGVAWLTGASVVAVGAISFLLSLAAQGGDLAESCAKRKFGAKDSGTLIPGHGGLLDRLDSLLTAVVVQGLILLSAGNPLHWRF